MAKQAVVLFGAGASMDAGLPGSYALSKKVYSKLVEAKSQDARLFGIIIAKLQLRGARLGRAPFEEINVEEVYDALKKFISRDQDILSEFVQSWEELAGNVQTEFDSQSFLDSLASAYRLDNRSRFDGMPTFRVKQRELIKATEILSKAFHGEFYRFRGASLAPFLSTLSTLLTVDDAKISYMQEFIKLHSRSISCIATLNYDRLVERSLETLGNSFDLGLSRWNDKRYIRFHGQSQKLIKLHGSVDWFIHNQDEINVNPDNPNSFGSRAMIFGGQDSKLVPFGPFLHLRHEFQTFLRGTNKLLIIGYSFGDDHLNAVLRSWVATRQNSQMMVVNPSGFDPNHSIMAFAKGRQKSEKAKASVSLEVVSKGMAEAKNEISEFLMRK